MANGLGASASFSTPVGIVFSNNTLYVADMYNNLVRTITLAGLVSTFAGSGSSTASDGAQLAAGLSQPAGIAADTSGVIYLADNADQKIRKNIRRCSFNISG